MIFVNRTSKRELVIEDGKYHAYLDDSASNIQLALDALRAEPKAETLMRLPRKACAGMYLWSGWKAGTPKESTLHRTIESVALEGSVSALMGWEVSDDDKRGSA